MTDKPRSPEQEKRPPLSYEEFRHRQKSEFYTDGYAPPFYNNFHLMFIDTEGNHRRTGEHGKALQKLREENPDLERTLTEALTHAFNERYNRPTSETRESLEPQLYEAYLIMRKCVHDDEALFA